MIIGVFVFSLLFLLKIDPGDHINNLFFLSFLKFKTEKKETNGFKLIYF